VYNIKEFSFFIVSNKPSQMRSRFDLLLFTQLSLLHPSSHGAAVLLSGLRDVPCGFLRGVVGPSKATLDVLLEEEVRGVFANPIKDIPQFTEVPHLFHCHHALLPRRPLLLR
jgi:hypothetical protein